MCPLTRPPTGRFGGSTRRALMSIRSERAATGSRTTWTNSPSTTAAGSNKRPDRCEAGPRAAAANEEEGMVFEVLDGGPQSTIQDVGRPGYLATRMPPSDAADRFALRAGNLLVGTAPGQSYLLVPRPGSAWLSALLSGRKL